MILLALMIAAISTSHVTLPDQEVNILEALGIEPSFSHIEMAAGDTLSISVKLSNRLEHDLWLNPRLQLGTRQLPMPHPTVESEVMAIISSASPQFVNAPTAIRDCSAPTQGDDAWCVLEPGATLQLDTWVSWYDIEVPAWPSEYPITVSLVLENPVDHRGQMLEVARESIWVK